MNTSFATSLYICLQHIVPQHTISRVFGLLANARLGAISHWVIRRFISAYSIDMSQAQQTDPTAFHSFNEFFTRAPKPRTFTGATCYAPTDATISQLGRIDASQTLIQAKCHSYHLEALLANSHTQPRIDTRQFNGGNYATLYLSPADIHRIYMPIAGTLQTMRFVPGKLFAVNTTTSNHVDNLFARNERLICMFDTAIGPLAVIFVGAMIVGSMATSWAGVIQPTPRVITTTKYNIDIACGADIGHFQLGSTIILLTGSKFAAWNTTLTAGMTIRIGDGIIH